MPDNTKNEWIPWEGILLPLDTPSANGRLVVAAYPPGVISLPEPLPVLDQDAGEYAGQISRMWVHEGAVHGEGTAHPEVLESENAQIHLHLKPHQTEQDGDATRYRTWQVIGAEWWPPAEGEAPAGFPGAHVRPVARH